MKKIIILLWVGMLASFLPGECAAAVKLACLGDSITAGMLVKKEDCWVSRIAKELDKKAEVGNFGVSARCLLFRGDRPITREKVYQDALAFKPDVLLIGMGTNDSKKVNWSHKDDFVDNYKEIIAEFRKQNPKLKVYCLLPIPSQEAREGGISKECIEKEVIPLIRQAAKSTRSKVIDLNKVMKGRDNLLVDGVHPNAEGHGLMAEHILLVLKGKAVE
ncbi:GDSL-type esterase/lipase family protein [Akkermansia sp.]|uniref:GDSL-type esterase/lipase family protein n=1 Tax=Akkermansia sp. TaxID=1872421 RepID=UPI0025BFB2E6|nr:GDSL-type esterase/lipase family protein [Akkermansia sp.]